MDHKLIERYTGLPTGTIQYYMALSATDIANDPGYLQILTSLDRNYLEKTLPQARAAYEKGLPKLLNRLEKQYNLQETMMSPYTLGNWLVGVLQYPRTAPEILKMHHRIPAAMIADGLPDLLKMLDDMPEGAPEWQQALCLMCLPLLRK